MAQNRKFSPMRYTAATEEAAVQGAMQIVGVSREDIEVEIIEEGAKGVTVRIKPRSDEQSAPPATETVAQTSPIVEDVPELLAQDEASEDMSQISPEIDEDAGEIEAQNEESSADYADEAPEIDEDIPADMPEIEAPPVPVAPELVARAQAKAQEFLDKMGLESSVQIGQTRDANTIPLVIEGEDVGILIGKHGATLQSFQYLLNLTLGVHAEGEMARVVVDAGNYRARRQSSLEQTARYAASKTRRDGRAIRLDPMPAHERRLVHLFLQGEPDIATHSEGREPMRRIVVSPASNAPSSNAPTSAPRAERSFGEGRSAGSPSGMGGYGRRGDGSGRGGNRSR
ncbi:MAG: KH domain-containing protein [Armatimonadetes bacterium]|nr:KH domain-containing protein [Armatimonadota bacterium]